MNHNLVSMVIDNGVFLFMIVYYDIELRFLSDVFNLSSFKELSEENPDYIKDNDTELNKRIQLSLEQIKKDNYDHNQPFAILCLKY